MRFFIALEIPVESRQELEQIQAQISHLIPGVRLTDNDKLHLTIAFIGDQPDHLKDRLIQIIAQSVQNIPPFQVTPAYIDGFPSLHHAETLWFGVKGDIDKLMILQERIKDNLWQLHLSVDDRRYVPHIAFGKTPSSFQLSEQQEQQLQEMMMNPFTPIQITSIKLFESVPDESFHRHNTLAEIKLS